MRLRGFSLLELIVSCALFTGLSVLLFSFFRFGTRAFATANQKNGMQTGALRSIESLRSELERSSQSSVFKKTDASRDLLVDGETVHRDVISFCSLRNWKDRTNADNYELETGAPKWNRYWVYYATKLESGSLIRLKVDPNPAPEGPMPLLEDYFDRLYYDDPTSNRFDGESPMYTTLTKNVYNFDIGSMDRGSFPITLKLRDKHMSETVEPGPRRSYDYYELKVRITPENSFRNDL